MRPVICSSGFSHLQRSRCFPHFLQNWLTTWVPGAVSSANLSSISGQIHSDMCFRHFIHHILFSLCFQPPRPECLLGGGLGLIKGRIELIIVGMEKILTKQPPIHSVTQVKNTSIANKSIYHQAFTYSPFYFRHSCFDNGIDNAFTTAPVHQGRRIRIVHRCVLLPLLLEHLLLLCVHGFSLSVMASLPKFASLCGFPRECSTGLNPRSSYLSHLIFLSRSDHADKSHRVPLSSRLHPLHIGLPPLLPQLPFRRIKSRQTELLPYRVSFLNLPIEPVNDFNIFLLVAVWRKLMRSVLACYYIFP